ncbi:hypothetical protein A2415_04200 [candidate division WWE3 bacterium RIFOXYC1_FULL_39_7]|uniref:Carotenoid oxygenase n=2 Tax=Katanobacteria TaxID=422282 RepID=A0A1F4X9C1_UNCKA|nr:MAG: hypothetical protein A2415_04200 [candidate division WWE3 bacterium RIFOXYC1_FULL_39_7]OGC77653.1 MAG: hypothetical protein A2619_05455 [candidate division WWE3 bacterium RIFOXYD1_FULL_39_9]
MVIIFDYDGTIADTIGLFLKYVSQNLSEINNVDKLESDVNEIRNRSIRENLAYYKISWLKFLWLYFLNKKKIEDYVVNAKIFEGMREVFQELQNEGHSQFILTSHSGKKVQSFLERNNLNYFKVVYSSSRIFSKHSLLEKLLAENNLTKEECLYVGDEVRDIQACKKTGVKIISVTWGFNSNDFLKKYDPDFLANTPADILQIVQQINISRA